MNPTLRRIESDNEVGAEKQSVDIGDQTKSVDVEGNIDDWQAEENMFLFRMVPPKPLHEPLPVEQKKGEQIKGIVEPQKEIRVFFDTSPVTAYEISKLLEPRSIWPRSGKNFVNSQRGKLYFREHRHMGFDNVDLIEDMSCCSCVQADIKWANRLLKQVGISRTDQNIIALDLRSAQPKVFESLLGKNGAGVSAVKDFMNELSQINVCVKACDNSMREANSLFWYRFMKSYEILCAAAALALTIRLRSEDDVLFSRLVGYSSSVVIRQIASHQRGALITKGVVKIALKCVTETLITKSSQLDETISKSQLSDVAANLVSTFIKHHAHEGEEPLKRAIFSLISEIKDSLNRDFDIRGAAILTGIIYAGTIKRAIEIATRERKLHENVKAIIGITLSVVGSCGIVGVDKVTGLGAIIVDIGIEKWWKLKYEGLASNIRKFVRDSVYWRLEFDNIMPFSSLNSKDKLTFEQKQNFKSCFELVMGANHL